MEFHQGQSSIFVVLVMENSKRKQRISSNSSGVMFAFSVKLLNFFISSELSFNEVLACWFRMGLQTGMLDGFSFVPSFILIGGLCVYLFTCVSLLYFSS